MKKCNQVKNYMLKIFMLKDLGVIGGCGHFFWAKITQMPKTWFSCGLHSMGN